MNKLSEADWQQYQAEGYLRLGRVGQLEDVRALAQRLDEIMLGNADINYDKTLMQLDSTDGAYESAGEQSLGHKGATLNYRKIEQLEFDPLFLAYMQQPVFQEIAERIYPGMNVACFRAMFMNKPANRGTVLPVHQDRWNWLDRDPLITLYLAIDPATIANGCVEIVPGSHYRLLNPEHDSGYLTPEMAEPYRDASTRLPLELAEGEVVLLHNWTLHSSGVNQTSKSRRAFSFCLMDADTRFVQHPETLASKRIIFGEHAMSPISL